MRKEVCVLCPVCNVDLQISERQNIEIDYCPKCRGVWLDRGELDKIIERANNMSNVNEPVNNQAYGQKRKNDDTYRYDQPDYDYDRDDDRRVPHDQRRRKRSFFDDIFDVFD